MYIHHKSQNIQKLYIAKRDLIQGLKAFLECSFDHWNGLLFTMWLDAVTLRQRHSEWFRLKKWRLPLVLCQKPCSGLQMILPLRVSWTLMACNRGCSILFLACYWSNRQIACPSHTHKIVFSRLFFSKKTFLWYARKTTFYQAFILLVVLFVAVSLLLLRL